MFHLAIIELIRAAPILAFLLLELVSLHLMLLRFIILKLEIIVITCTELHLHERLIVSDTVVALCCHPIIGL